MSQTIVGITQRELDRARRLVPLGVPRWVHCYDNRGESIDRYTVVYTGQYTRRTGGSHWYLRMSASPFHPQGVGMHGEHSCPIDWPTYGHIGKRIDFATLPDDCQRLARQTYGHIGKRIDFATLPDDCQRLARQTYASLWNLSKGLTFYPDLYAQVARCGGCMEALFPEEHPLIWFDTLFFGNCCLPNRQEHLENVAAEP